MSTNRVAADQRQKVYALLQGRPRAYAWQEEECRRLAETVHWIQRASAQWRDLPD